MTYHQNKNEKGQRGGNKHACSRDSMITHHSGIKENNKGKPTKLKHKINQSSFKSNKTNKSFNNLSSFINHMYKSHGDLYHITTLPPQVIPQN